MSLLVTRIGELVTNDPRHGGPLGVMPDAALVVEDGRVAWVGSASRAPAADRTLDVGGAAVIPGFVDSHAHLVFAGDRAGEFAARMAGQPYTGGGIRTTVAATRSASDDDLRATASRLIKEARRQGTTTIEIKSGYGLTVTDEARSLKVAAEFSAETTFLGAHVVPTEYDGRTDDYVALVCKEMLTAAAPHARWVDVFCDNGAFDGDQARTVLTAGMAAGLLPRIHANQLGHGPGVALAVELGAASADHCTHLSTKDVDGTGGIGDRGNTTARRRVLHPVAVPGCPAAAGCRCPGRPGHRLQPRLVLHLVDAVLCGAGRPGDADDPGRGVMGRHRRWCVGFASH